MTALTERIEKARPPRFETRAPEGDGEDVALAREIRAGIHIASYKNLLKSAEVSANQRAILALATPTTLGVLLGVFNSWKTGHGSGYDVLADFAPAAGVLICIAFLSIGISRYREECRYVKRAIVTEKENGLNDGSAMVRAQELQFDKWWIPSRGAVSSACCGICIVVVAIVQFWSGGTP